MNRATLGVGEDLHLDVAGAHDCLLEEHRRVAERAVGLAHGGFEGIPQVLGLVDPAHPPAATTGHGLREDGEADVGRACQKHLDVFRRRRRLEHRNTGGDGVLLGGDLVARHFEHARWRTDEGDSGVCCGLGEVGIL